MYVDGSQCSQRPKHCPHGSKKQRASPTRFHFWGPLKNLIGRWELRDISVLAESGRSSGLVCDAFV